MDQGAHSRNTLYVLLGVWLAIAAFAITIFAIVAAYSHEESAMVAPFAAAAVYTLATIGYLLLRQWRALERDLTTAVTRAVVADEEGRAKLTFLGAMSHELRTPLNAIIGFSQVIEQEVFGPMNVPQYVEYVGLIRTSGLYLLTTLNDILDMAKLEKDLASAEVRNTLEENMRLAEAMGMNGTPSYVIGKQVVIGAVGVSGDTSDNDEIAALAGIAAAGLLAL